MLIMLLADTITKGCRLSYDWSKQLLTQNFEADFRHRDILPQPDTEPSLRLYAFNTCLLHLLHRLRSRALRVPLIILSCYI